MKGSQFERDVCTQLSEWMSGGERDDLFWRTAGSGGRATVRGRRGKKTASSEGDICATHEDGEPLTKLITFELKRGYNHVHIDHFLDMPPGCRIQKIEEWINQAVLSHRLAETPYWMIIHKKDRRPAVVYFDDGLYRVLQFLGCFSPSPVPKMTLLAHSRHAKKDYVPIVVVCMQLDHFLQQVDAGDIRAAYRHAWWE